MIRAHLLLRNCQTRLLLALGRYTPRHAITLLRLPRLTQHRHRYPPMGPYGDQCNLTLPSQEPHSELQQHRPRLGHMRPLRPRRSHQHRDQQTTQLNLSQLRTRPLLRPAPHQLLPQDNSQQPTPQTPSRAPVPQVAGSRRRQRRTIQATNPLQAAGITPANWTHMATIDALPILKQNIIALNKCPAHYRNLWRFAVTEVNQAGQSSDPIIRKGAEITLALLPNMLLRAPSTEERLLSTRQKMDSRFAKFFA